MMNYLVPPLGGRLCISVFGKALLYRSPKFCMLIFSITRQNLLFLASSFTMATYAIMHYIPENIIWLPETTVGRRAHRLVGRESVRMETKKWGMWNI